MPKQSGTSVGKARASSGIKAGGVPISGAGSARSGTSSGVNNSRGRGIRMSGIALGNGPDRDRKPVVVAPSGSVTSWAQKVRDKANPDVSGVGGLQQPTP